MLPKIYKRLIPLMLIPAILPAILACTQNNGHIGKIFGSWKLVSIVTEGIDLPEYNDDVIWGFQSSVIQMTRIQPMHHVVQTAGAFRLMDNTLFLSFPDDEHPPLNGLGIPREAEFQVLRLTAKELILVRHPSDTQSITYSFRRW